MDDLRIWWYDFAERWSRRVICPVFGHRWGPKMTGYICYRCRIWDMHRRKWKRGD